METLEEANYHLHRNSEGSCFPRAIQSQSSAQSHRILWFRSFRPGKSFELRVSDKAYDVA
jgi:hypothetical protein